MRPFVEALKRLYGRGDIDQDKVVELFVSGKINDEEKWYILKQE